MTILVIAGPPKSGKSMIAAALRNNQITLGKGALLIDEQQEGELQHQLEKIIIAEPLKPGTPAADVPWKPDPLVILVGAKANTLEQIEALAPGFTEALGPTLRLTTALK